MQIASRLPWSALGSGALLEAHVHGTLPGALRVPGLGSVAALARRPPLDADLRVALQRAMDPDLARRFDAFADPRTLAVVTGQQPGCAGGPILVLLKAATAVALARRIARALARPVVPVFWNAADDVDFDEVARVGWPTPDGALLFLELPAASRKAQGFVGDLPGGRRHGGGGRGAIVGRRRAASGRCRAGCRVRRTTTPIGWRGCWRRSFPSSPSSMRACRRSDAGHGRSSGAMSRPRAPSPTPSKPVRWRRGRRPAA